MSKYNLSRIYLSKDGYYHDLNGNRIAKKGNAIFGDVWRLVADLNGRDYANQMSKNTRSGNIFLNGKWRLNDVLSDKEGRTATWEEAMSRLNANAKSTPSNNGTTNPQNKKQLLPKKPQLNAPDSIGGKALKWFGDVTGLYHTNSTSSDLLGTSFYFVPGLGNVLAAGDAINDLRKGNWGDAAMNTVFALPFIGNIGRGLKAGLTAAKFAKAANKVNKGVKLIGKLEKPANTALNALLLYLVPKMGSDLYTGYQSVKLTKQELKPTLDQLRNAGVSEKDIKNSFGDSYDIVNKMTSKDNTFTGNLGTMWDLMLTNE